MGSRRQQQSEVNYPDPTENNEDILRRFQQLNKQQNKRFRGLFRQLKQTSRETLGGLRQQLGDTQTATLVQQLLSRGAGFSSLVDRLDAQKLERLQMLQQQNLTSQAKNAVSASAAQVDEQRQNFVSQLLRSRQ